MVNVPAENDMLTTHVLSEGVVQFAQLSIVLWGCQSRLALLP